MDAPATASPATLRGFDLAVDEADLPPKSLGLGLGLEGHRPQARLGTMRA